MSRGWIDINEVENKLQKAYDLLLYNDDLESEEARGFVAEVLAMLNKEESA
jgi:polyhydroxyalkanoate synthesis regulator phasin